MLWIPIMRKIGGGVLYPYLQSVQAYIAPPITCVFLLGIPWERINARGAITTLLFGLLVRTLRIISELGAQPGGSGLIYEFARSSRISRDDWKLHRDSSTRSLSSTALEGDHERKNRVLSRTPMGKTGKSGDIENAVYFPASGQAAGITGVTLAVEGGNCIGL